MAGKMFEKGFKKKFEIHAESDRKLRENGWKLLVFDWILRESSRALRENGRALRENGRNLRENGRKMYCFFFCTNHRIIAQLKKRGLSLPPMLQLRACPPSFFKFPVLHTVLDATWNEQYAGQPRS